MRYESVIAAFAIATHIANIYLLDDNGFIQKDIEKALEDFNVEIVGMLENSPNLSFNNLIQVAMVKIKNLVSDPDDNFRKGFENFFQRVFAKLNIVEYNSLVRMDANEEILKRLGDCVFPKRQLDLPILKLPEDTVRIEELLQNPEIINAST